MDSLEAPNNTPQRSITAAKGTSGRRWRLVDKDERLKGLCAAEPSRWPRDITKDLSASEGQQQSPGVVGTVLGVHFAYVTGGDGHPTIYSTAGVLDPSELASAGPNRIRKFEHAGCACLDAPVTPKFCLNLSSTELETGLHLHRILYHEPESIILAKHNDKLWFLVVCVNFTWKLRRGPPKPKVVHFSY